MQRHVRFVAGLSAGLFVGAAGCQSSDKSDHDRTAGHQPHHGHAAAANPTSQPARVQNQMTARQQLEDAEKAEREGQYSHALEVYQYLKSYPEASRPKDLDQRIKRVEERMNQGR
jgi:hypothetical protein